VLDAPMKNTNKRTTAVYTDHCFFRYEGNVFALIPPLIQDGCDFL
jgi:hypothetical protein